MWTRHRVSVLLISILVSACATTESPEPRNCETHTFKFQVDNQGCVKKIQRDAS